MNEDPIIILERKIDTLVERVEQLERELRVLKEQRASASLGSYSAIGASSAASSVAGDTSSIASNDYNSLAETIPPVPQDVLRACSLLRGGGIPFADRAARAWEAGYWPRFCLEGLLSKPRPTRPISLPNQYYAVLRAEICGGRFQGWIPLSRVPTGSHRSARLGSTHEQQVSLCPLSRIDGVPACDGGGRRQMVWWLSAMW